MATRHHRIAEFNTGDPPSGQPLEILCEDHNGTYVPRFACLWINGAWVGPSGPLKRRCWGGESGGVELGLFQA